MSHQKYYDYLQSLGHVLKLDENGNVDAFGHDFENHNGPSCINCGASWCHHCEEDAQVCEKELNSPPDVYDIVVDTGDGIYYTAEVVHFQQSGSKRMIQVKIGEPEPQADDVRKDAERLDWIEKKFCGLSDSERYLPFRLSWGKGNNKTLREAIDKARE